MSAISKKKRKGSVKKIVMTGGSSSGKSSFVKKLEKLSKRKNCRVFFIPEIVTMTFDGIPDFLKIVKKDFQKFLNIEKEILKTQMGLLRYYESFASLFPEDDIIIILDRGPIDVSAYLPEGYFEAISRELGFTAYDYYNFDLAIHLVTAADGAEKFYNRKNNNKRRETAPQARELDKMIMNAYADFEHVVVIDNSTGFEEKMERAYDAVLKMLDKKIETERRYLLGSVPDFKANDVYTKTVSMKQSYLAGECVGIRVRECEYPLGPVYYKTVKEDIAGSFVSRYEDQSIISPVDYLNFLKFQDSETDVVEKDRIYFWWKKQRFELNKILLPDGSVILLLEIEFDDENQEIALPDFLDVVREVTSEPEYSSRNIAKRIKRMKL